jgi:hypothetical protein
MTTKSFQKSESRSLIVALILSCFTGILLFFISKDQIISEIDLALLFIVGMTTMAALEAFHEYFAGQIKIDRNDNIKKIDSKDR